jgi:hypothetical protein
LSYLVQANKAVHLVRLAYSEQQQQPTCWLFCSLAISTPSRAANLIYNNNPTAVPFLLTTGPTHIHFIAIEAKVVSV